MRALVFDFDGLILDTEGPEFRAWQSVYEDHGVLLTLETWQVCIGTSGAFDPVAHLESLVERTLDAEAVQRLRRRRRDEFMATETVRPGVADHVEAALTRGMRLAVASSSTRDWVGRHLEVLGLRDRFACLRCSDDVAEVKPSPELYLSALESLEVEAHEAIAIEDSANGVTAAKAAGLFCVAVPNALTRSMDLSHADLRLDSLADMSLDDLIACAARV